MRVNSKDGKYGMCFQLRQHFSGRNNEVSGSSRALWYHEIETKIVLEEERTWIEDKDNGTEAGHKNRRW